uniref:Uncharacterized protein n=1 Tax=Trichuris muris TaxID=70415 RepID=A0A5S6QGZ3_TRIMR
MFLIASTSRNIVNHEVDIAPTLKFDLSLAFCKVRDCEILYVMFMCINVEVHMSPALPYVMIVKTLPVEPAMLRLRESYTCDVYDIFASEHTGELFVLIACALKVLNGIPEPGISVDENSRDS